VTNGGPMGPVVSTSWDCDAHVMDFQFANAGTAAQFVTRVEEFLKANGFEALSQGSEFRRERDDPLDLDIVELAHTEVADTADSTFGHSTVHRIRYRFCCVRAGCRGAQTTSAAGSPSGRQTWRGSEGDSVGANRAMSWATR